MTLYNGVLEILKNLSSRYDLFLVSKNEPNRYDNINSLDISKYFKKVLFVEEKTTQIFKALAENDKKVLIIGDRVKGEISIGNELGFITVWIKQGKFADELPQNKDEIPKHSIDEINQLYKIIRIYE